MNLMQSVTKLLWTKYNRKFYQYLLLPLFFLPRYPGVFCIQRLAQRLRLFDSFVNPGLIAVP